MFFDIAIAAGPDPAALERVIDAIERNRYHNYAITLWLTPDRDQDVRRLFGDDWRVQSLETVPEEQSGVFARWNAALALSRADVIVCLTDDLEASPDCLESLRRGFEQEGLDILTPLRIAPGDRRGPALGAVALGAKFVSHFPRRHCFCPDYRWFHGDAELIDFAHLTGRLRMIDDACVERFITPLAAMDPGLLQENRKRHRRDGRVRRKRRRNGQLWGRDCPADACQTDTGS